MFLETFAEHENAAFVGQVGDPAKSLTDSDKYDPPGRGFQNQDRQHELQQRADQHHSPGKSPLILAKQPRQADHCEIAGEADEAFQIILLALLHVLLITSQAAATSTSAAAAV